MSSLPAENDFPRLPWRQAPVVFLLLLGAILAFTWPWCLSFSSATLEHWDPPFHAWKLEYVARSLLAGHLLPPDGNTNMYYPYSGVLYFEALHWPQAVVAALFFRFTSFNPLLVYHWVYLLFWALSGLFFWMWLLAMNATRRAALLGALVFTLMPYRISYLMEFNMQLNWGLPLFFFFLVRYFQRPAIRYACGLALAWWLQAASELYQAVFLILLLPFPALALLVAHRQLLRSFRRFWLPVLCGALLGGGVTAALLGPYLTLLHIQAVHRNLQEIATHLLEPLSYLRPDGRFRLIPLLDVRRDEMCVYPTLAVLVLAALHHVFRLRAASTGSSPPWARIARATAGLSLLLFAILSVKIYFTGATGGWARLYSFLPPIAIFALTCSLFDSPDPRPASVFTAGLLALAAAAYFFSLGPVMTMRHSHFGVDNHLFLWTYKGIELLHGFRVISRFSVFVLIYLILAATLAWSQIERRWLQRPAWRWLWLLPLALALFESYPDKPFRLRPLEVPYTTPVLETLDRLGQPYVLAMVPMGQRLVDSRHMLQIARTDRLSVYAWGGAYPRLTRQIREALDPRAPQPATAARLLRQLWPECFVLEDKLYSRRRRLDFYHPLLTRQWRGCDYSHLLRNQTEILAEDDRFVLMRLTPEENPSVEEIRLVRHDWFLRNPLVVFRARVPADAAPATLWLDVNGYVVGRWVISAESTEFRALIPACYFLPLLPNRLRFHATADAPFHLDSFHLQPVEFPLPPSADESLAATQLPWLGHIQQLPPSALPLHIRYPSGFEILGCEPLETEARPGEAIRLRVYVRCPRDLKVAVNSNVRARLLGPDGQWIEEGLSLAGTDDLQNVRCQLHPSIYDLNISLTIPDRLVPGEYRLLLLLRNRRNQRQTGQREGQRGKLFPVPIPIWIQPAPEDHPGSDIPNTPAKTSTSSVNGRPTTFV